MPFTNLLFDADNTLLDFPKSERSAFSAVCCAVGLPDSEENYRCYSDINAALWREFDTGAVTHEDIFSIRFPRFLKAIGSSCNPAVCRRVYESGMARGFFLFPEAETVCQVLSQNHALYIVTNATAGIHRARLAGSAIAPYITRPFISEELGLSKPDPAFFAAVLRQIPGASAENTLVIGDSLTTDMQGASNGGLPCCWFNPHRLPHPSGIPINYEIHALSELLQIL